MPRPPIPADMKLPWMDAAFLVASQAPYVADKCVRNERGGRGHRAYNPLYGMCYTCSEALFHLSEDVLVPHWVKYGPERYQTHWYLRLPQEDNRVVDLTASQFSDWDLYSLYEWGRPRPFGTTYPSKRACMILERIVEKGTLFTRRFNDLGLVDDHQEYLEIKRRRAEIRRRKAENSNPKV